MYNNNSQYSIADHRIHGGLLEITVVGCNKLKDTEWISRQDPYVCLEYASHRNRTRDCTDGGKNPIFQEKFVYSLVEGLRELNVIVWNRNTVSRDDFIGSGKVQLGKVLSQGFDDSSWPLQTKTGRHAGEVRLIMHYSSANNPANSYGSSAPPYGTSSSPQVSMYSAPPPSLSYPPPASLPTYPPATTAAYSMPSSYSTYAPNSGVYPPSPYSTYAPNSGVYPPSPYSTNAPNSGVYPPSPYPPQAAPYPPQQYPSTSAYPPQQYPSTSAYPPQPYPSISVYPPHPRGSQYPHGSSYPAGYPSTY